MKIYLGADHRGFYLKEHVKPWLSHWGVDFEDLGAIILDPHDDYPAYAARVAHKVTNDKKSLGILICGSGVGVEVVANKFDGIRASVGKNPLQVEAGRKDDDMNVLVIASDFTKENEAKMMLEKFLKTKFSNKLRHRKRLLQIKEIEKTN